MPTIFVPDQAILRRTGIKPRRECLRYTQIVHVQAFTTRSMGTVLCRTQR